MGTKMKAMNRWIFFSSILSFVTAVVHVFAGGPEVHDTLLTADLPILLKTYVSVIWHATTTILVIDSIALLTAAFRSDLRKAIIWIVVGQYVAYAILFVGYGLGYLGSLLTTPQWSAFALISALALIGMKDRAVRTVPLPDHEHSLL